MKSIAILFLLTFSFVLNAQQPASDPPADKKLKKNEIQEVKDRGEQIKFERPVNLFAAAGITVRTIEVYDVTVSPIDYSVQFDRQSLFNTGLATGVIWNPCKNLYAIYHYKKKGKVDTTYEYVRTGFAVAMLINVFKFNVGADNVFSSAPIDFGIGLGYRFPEAKGLAILGTIEFSPTRQPRNFLWDQFRYDPHPLTPYGAPGPLTSFDTKNDAYFKTTLVPAIGIRIVWSFLEKSEEND